MRRAWLGLFLALTGCDPTAGLADSADAAVPEVKRYFDGRGSLLSEGPWNRVVVDLDPDTLYHVGARRLDDEQPTFHLFGADAREGCQVAPNAGTWLLAKPQDAPFRLLPFQESADESGRGRMRFTSVDCAVQDLVIEDAGNPAPRSYGHGYLVPTKRGYTFADPWRGEQRVIFDDFRDIVLWDLGVVLLRADDRLKSFSDRFEPGSEWGNATVAAIKLGNDFLVEDADGIHRVELDRHTLGLKSEPVLPGACGLQRSGILTYLEGAAWIAVHTPCDNPRPTLLAMDFETFEPRDSFELPIEIDARYVRVLTRKFGADEEPQFVVFYLTNVDEGRRGTLWAWRQGSDEPIRLAEKADIDSCYLGSPDSAWDGGAQVNQRSFGAFTTRDWLRFRWDGTTDLSAEGVLNAPSGDLLINFDGVAGDLASFDAQAGYDVLARGIPPSSGERASFTGTRHYSRVDRFDGSAGRLLLGTQSGDPRTWKELGSDVPPELVLFSWFMPALVFVEHWNADSRTGDLVAYNYDLDARSKIAEGVSSFDLTGYPLDGVVYTVPSGDGQGIWFSKAK
jgi:hypothetical protein